MTVYKWAPERGDLGRAEGKGGPSDYKQVSTLVIFNQKLLMVPLMRRANGSRVQILGKDPLFWAGQVCCVCGTHWR